MSDGVSPNQRDSNQLLANLLEEPAPPRNLQDLLRYAIQAGESGIPDHAVPLSAERRSFLEQAIKALTIDVAEDIYKAINTLKNLQNPESEQCDDSVYVDALDTIGSYVDHIDAANDFYKLGGFDIIGVCLASPSPDIRWRIADILAQCTQNNPFCQAHAVSMNLMETLLPMVERDDDEKCRVKAFFAVSAIVRDYPEGLRHFMDQDGFSYVLRGLQSPVEKLQVKAAFFLSSIISSNPETKEILLKMGFVEQLIALIREEHTQNHEHLTAVLLSLVENSEEAQAECRRPELELKSTLQKIQDENRCNEAFREEMAYIDNLVTLVFGDDHEEER